ncbi:transcriptional regulator [Shinella kummerowiae]|uniref:transcriptional regulator n=1 Tax=Shinella kummerowiae TaxID=417745 RepID=UPI0021B5EAB3|nr:transcriptional regulator [Shinella kummerowiae]MCT7662253.1 transcriptional regulator [Shinella kummerowiae]
MTPIARPVTDYVEKAATAWDGAAPDWIVVLAEACSKSSQSAVAKKVGYSAPTLSAVLGNAYKGNMAKVEEAVRWQLIGETVPCPQLGTMRKTECQEWQEKPYAATSSHRVAMFRACRDGCPYSRITINTEKDA